MLHVCFFNVSILIIYPSWSLAHIIQHYPTSDPKYKILLLRLKSAAETLPWQLINRNFSNFVSTESFEIPISAQFLFSRNWFENEASNASHVWKLNSKTSWKKRNRLLIGSIGPDLHLLSNLNESSLSLVAKMVWDRDNYSSLPGCSAHVNRWKIESDWQSHLNTLSNKTRAQR